MPKPARPKGSLLAGSISISNLKPVQEHKPVVQAEVRPLTQELLEQYWEQAATDLNLADLMHCAKPRLGDTPRIVEIDATTTYFHDDFKPHRINVMEKLRQLAGMPMLECKGNPLYVDSEVKLYSPVEKYNAMLEHNPKLQELRKLLPQIDL